MAINDIDHLFKIWVRSFDLACKVGQGGRLIHFDMLIGPISDSPSLFLYRMILVGKRS